MKNKFSATYLLIASVLMSALFFVSGCKKDEIVTPDQRLASFAKASDSYYITSDPNTVYKIPVGLTQVADKDIRIDFTVSSSTGAVEGQQYTLSSHSVIIPAGKFVDSISVKGLFAGYASGRKDVLTFKITGGDVPALIGSDVFTLNMQKYCPVVASDLTGNYANTRDYDKTTSGAASASKYTAVISSWTPINATSATIIIKNLGASGDIGFGPFTATDPAAIGLTATVDFSNPANFTLTLPSQPYVNSLYTYGASTVSGSGTFSSCDQSFVITFVVKVSAGSFTAVAAKLLR